MRSLLSRLLTLACAVACAHAAAQALPPPVRQALVQSGIPESAVAIYVQDVAQADPLLALNVDAAFNPASTIKLLTTYAALDLLGPAYAWNTEVLTTGRLEGDVLNGDLVLRGSGDPKLTLEAFWLLLRQVRARGIREIRGDLVLDRTAFAADDSDPSRFDNEPTRPYNTPPDALLVNFRAIRVSFVPDPERRTVSVLTEPALPQVQVLANLVLDNEPCGDWLARLKVAATGTGNAARLLFSGAYSTQCGERTRNYSVLAHSQYLLGLFQTLWRELGGTFTGGARDGAVPPGAKPLFAQPSPPLAEVVRDINKFSNNVMARQLFLTLGTVGLGAPGDADKATRVVRAWAAQKKLALPELVLENGSGLSRIERITARGLGQLLLSAWRSPVMSELMSSLPLVAVDGTMRRRLANSELAGQAHIKTGSLTGVRAIAGYVLDARGRTVVVVCLVNHPRALAAQPLQDALLAWVYSR
ncbi:MAG: D-alanyl-D-alanine carboxypeptidase/D-alanyl-D-alanine endopeptidase [Burkholderiales bacterium]